MFVLGNIVLALLVVSALVVGMAVGYYWLKPRA